MDKGNIDVGTDAATSKPGQLVERLAGVSASELPTGNSLKTEAVRICGAMSLQRGDSGRGNEYVPQKFVHLVGCRDPKVRPEPWVRPRPAAVKR